VGRSTGGCAAKINGHTVERALAIQILDAGADDALRSLEIADKLAWFLAHRIR